MSKIKVEISIKLDIFFPLFLGYTNKMLNNQWNVNKYFFSINFSNEVKKRRFQ